MKKFIFSMLMLIGAISMNAQTAYEKANVFDNVYMGINAGASMPLTMNSVFPLNSQASLRIGKDFSPIFGAFVEGTAVFGDNVGWGHDYCMSHTFVKYSNVGINGTANWMNLFGGYKGTPRTFEIISVAGIGWMHTYGNNEFFYQKDNFSAKTAFDFAFNLGKSKIWQIYIEPQVTWNLTATDGVIFDKNYAQLGLSVGANYRFPTSNGTHNFKAWNINELNETINTLRGENQNLNDEVNRLKHTKPTIVERYIENVTEKTTIVTFAQNSAEISGENAARLKQVNAKNVSVKAYASPEGSNEVNQNLSQQRANNVTNYLKKNGVNVTSSVGCGVSGNESNRIAIITAE